MRAGGIADHGSKTGVVGIVGPAGLERVTDPGRFDVDHIEAMSEAGANRNLPRDSRHRSDQRETVWIDRRPTQGVDVYGGTRGQSAGEVWNHDQARRSANFAAGRVDQFLGLRLSATEQDAKDREIAPALA